MDGHEKKATALSVVFMLLMAVLYGCCSSGQVAGSAAVVSRVPSDVDVEILEDFWVMMINQIFNNFDDYYGKTVGIEGVFSKIDIGDAPYHMVFRNERSC